jgi:hypothetical protein
MFFASGFFLGGYIFGKTNGRTLAARNCSVWLDGDELENVGNVWIERLKN